MKTKRLNPYYLKLINLILKTRQHKLLQNKIKLKNNYWSKKKKWDS